MAPAALALAIATSADTASAFAAGVELSVSMSTSGCSSSSAEGDSSGMHCASRLHANSIWSSGRKWPRMYCVARPKIRPKTRVSPRRRRNSTSSLRPPPRDRGPLSTRALSAQWERRPPSSSKTSALTENFSGFTPTIEDLTSRAKKVCMQVAASAGDAPSRKTEVTSCSPKGSSRGSNASEKTTSMACGLASGSSLSSKKGISEVLWLRQKSVGKQSAPSSAPQ
mmetsp:Transcript_19261/g.57845  ORF Transcript_19261/g.57845 Transcript_19261/m.57845 type:complete len:225 (+) Transcript_19261:361-1035(+)